jgi:hypothetical protein
VTMNGRAVRAPTQCNISCKIHSTFKGCGR